MPPSQQPERPRPDVHEISRMSPLEFVLTLFGICLVAGFVGSLMGLGGGVIVVPALTLVYGIDILLLVSFWLGRVE